MKSLFALFASLFFFQCFAQTESKFTVTGDVSSVKEKLDKVYYSYKLNGDNIKDSAEVKNNKYTLTGKINESVVVLINASYFDTSLKYDYRRDYKIVHISPGDNASMKHSDSFSIATVKGSYAHAEYVKMEAGLSVYNKKINALWGEMETLKAKNDTVTQKAKMAEIRKLADDMYAIYPKYIKQNPSSPIAIFVINQYRGPFLKPDDIEPMYNVLSDNIKNTWSGRELYKKLEIAKRVAIGKYAPNVTQKDSLGKAIALGDLKGKYVLLEFWASWCRPCREENPKLVKTYNKYHDKGFEILGVSVDVNRKGWLNAIKKDGLTWINTADMLDTNKNPAALTYGVEGIPMNFLIDPQGKIIANNLRGPELEKKLEELLGAGNKVVGTN